MPSAPEDRPGPALSWRLRLPRPDPLIAVCLLVLFGFPLVSVLAARGQPVQPRDALPPAPRGPGGKLHAIPEFTPGGTVAQTLRGRFPERAEFDPLIERAMAPLFEPRERRRLLRHVRDFNNLPEPGHSGYPYRYAGISSLVDAAIAAPPTAAQADAAADLAGLLMLAEAAKQPWAGSGQVAFALLDRARAGGACRPQLSLALLVATSVSQRQVLPELERAERACPLDPTPLWLRGQWESMAATDRYLGREPVPASAALVTFGRLQERFPGSSAGWSGMADALVRLAYAAEAKHQPFTARSRFQRAEELYRRARTLNADPRLGAGEARALAGQGRYDEAARLQATTAAATGRRGVVQAWSVELHERAREWSAAVAAAETLSTRRREAPGAGLFIWTPKTDQDTAGPLSEQVGQLRAFTARIETAPPHLVREGVVVTDLAFLPTFRHMDGVTGYDRWCPRWSRLRDLVLAGRAAEALESMPDPPPACDWPATYARELAAVITAEADEDRGETSDRLFDVRQNLWRFAGEHARAATVIARWRDAHPRSAQAADRAGEVAFLLHRYDEAAAAFGREVRLRRSSSEGFTGAEALALVKRGVALARAGRDAEALAAFASGDEIALRSMAETEPDDEAPARAAAYHARAQSGDLMLRAKRYADAADHYAAAREVQPDSAGFRIEVLDSNQAIVEGHLGRLDKALALARRAVAADPLSPLFLQNEGTAFARAGRPREAVVAYRRALRSDPSAFPVWNSLGVALSETGRREEAADAFRRAVGARPGYAAAWFNLGVTYERLGLAHVADAQGAFAKAVRLDPTLRDRRHELIDDDHVYFTTLDLSKPLPAKWEFASTQKQWPVPAAGLAMLMLLGVQMGRGAAGRRLTGGTGRWLDAALARLSKLPQAAMSLAPGAVAIVLTFAVFLVPAVRAAGASTLSVLAFGTGLVALVAMVMRARVLTARRAGVGLTQPAWRPALLVGGASAATGVPWAPFPLADPSTPTPSVHRAGPLVAAACGLALLALSAVVEIPATRSLGLAAVVMAASMLTPVGPLDGAKMDSGPATLSAGLALGGAAALVLLGLA